MKLKLLALAATLIVLSMLPVLTTGINLTDGETPAGVQAGYGIVLFRDAPIASYAGGISGLAPTKPALGLKLDLSSSASQAYAGYLANKQSYAKSWMASHLADVQVTNQYSIALNGFAVKLNGHPLDHLLQIPDALQVSPRVLYTIEMNRSPTLIGAPAAWTAVGGQSNAGAGIKIGIIDTGIDFTHPFLTDNSLPALAGFPKCDAKDSAVGQVNQSCKYVSNKVIVSKVFQDPTVSNFDAFAAQPHGSHVSGTAAGVANTCAPFVGCTLSGIAPKAYLGNYNVFPGNVTSQSSDVIAVAVEAAVADGMDVLNLSLGGLAEVGADPLVDAVNAAADAGVIVAVAAGNSGPFAGSIESPGIASGVITAGASTNPHFLGVPVAEQNSPMTTFGASVGAGPSYGSPTTAVLALWPGDNRACSPVSGTPFTGKIVLIRRGVCTFSAKDANAAAAGAIGMIVTNSVAGDPIAMGATFPFVIPGVMVSISNRPALLNYISAQGNNAIVSVNGGTPAEFFSDGAGADILAGFSSIGPPVLVNVIDPTKSRLVNLIKPDVTAPGVNVYSSVTSDQCSAPPCFAFFQGTSMATPHVAGSAAVLKQLHPNWSPSMIKSVLVTTAKRPVGSSGANTPLDNPMSRGGGRINLAAAIQAGATINTNNDQVDADFGLVIRAYAQRSIDVTVNSVITSTVTYTIAVNEAVTGACGCVSVSGTSITVRPGDGPNFSLRISMNPSILAGDYFGDVVLSGGAVALTVPYWFEFNPVAGPTSGHSSQA